jgi:signal transduction histidine kinase/ActR/RegA family two-component response regulator
MAAVPTGDAYRVVVLAPTGKDAALAQTILGRAGLSCLICDDVEDVRRALEDGAGALLLAEEAVSESGRDRFAALVHGQPAWSDLPILVLARPGADSAAVASAMDRLGNVTVLERPARVATVVSAVRAALRARQRQYEIRAHLEERRQAEQALRDADRRKDEFLAVLAHELRNPLAPVRNSLAILRLNGVKDATLRRATEMMERQVNVMVRLVDDLLEMSRITRDKLELRREPVEMAAVIASAVETSRPLVDTARLHLTLTLPAERLQVEGDPVRLAQVFSNLLNNATKYTEPGGEITLAVWRDGDQVAVSVRDTGVGIPADMLPRVFDMFTQVERHTERAQGGLGIGLTLVKRLVEMHGGTVTASSRGIGTGSEFVVRVPLRKEQVVCGAPAGAPAVLGRGLRVLVADDNRDAATSMGELLRLLGADVHVVFGGMDALAAVRDWMPDVALLDIGMPDLTGNEVARRIRLEPGLRDVMLIALTGWGQDDDRARSSVAGFDHHLTKPADLDALWRLLDTTRTVKQAASRGAAVRSMGAGRDRGH